MKNPSRSSIVLFFSILCSLLLTGGATTSANAQTKPAVNISDFFDEWGGKWTRNDESDKANFIITSSKVAAGAAQIEVKIYRKGNLRHFIIPDARLSDGELVVYKQPDLPTVALPDDPRNIVLKLVLLDRNSIKGFYYASSPGEYQLSRSLK